MADKEVEVSKTMAPAGRSSANKLSTPSRLTAYALGVAGLGAGGVAVFITHVEAGPVALLAVGLIFMIIALSGRLPTRLKIGENEAEWQEVAGEVIETAIEASPPSAKAQLANQLGELAEVAPRAAAPALSGLAYEQSIRQIIEQAVNKIPAVERLLTWVMLEEVGEFDFAIQATGNRFILVEVKASPRLSMSQAAMIIAKSHFYREAYPDRKTGVLLISRYSPSAGVRAMFMQNPFSAYVVVREREDEDTLIGAINGLLSDLGS